MTALTFNIDRSLRLTACCLTLGLFSGNAYASCSFQTASNYMTFERDMGTFWVGTTTASVPFHITLSDCEDASAPNPAAANVYIELDGANGSVPTVPAEGRFSLGAASDAAGVEIQLLRSDGTPMPLQSDELVKPVSIGITQLDFQARYYQSAPVVTPGLAEGGLTFTVSYK